MNILHIIYSIEKGGAETYIYDMLDNVERDMEFHIICNHKGLGHNELEKRLENISIIGMKSVFDIGAARKIAAYCRNKDMDLIQTHFLRENYIAVLSKLFNPRVKIIWTTHLIQENNIIVRGLNRIFSLFVDNIICVSQAVEDSLIREGISKKRTKLIYNGVDIDRFKNGANKIREELSIGKDILLMATVSRFHKEKGHDFLLEGLLELEKHISDFKILLVGEGEERPLIEKKVEEYGLGDKVIFLGYVDNVVDILSAIDIYISPSLMEAISFSVLEALACQVPVVATEVGGVPEIFAKGDCGILIPFGDEKLFAKAILDLYNKRSKYQSIKGTCRKIVKENFSQCTMLEETYGLYRQLAAGKDK